MEEIEISHFSKSGWGEGRRASGAILEVIGTLPGDRVVVPKGRRRVRPERWVAFAQGREEPRCAHFGECGGCRWQSMPYSMQLAEKERRIQALFDPLPVEPILASPSIWRYRNKMEFSFSADRAGNRFLGLCMAGGRGRVVSLSECHICPEWMIETLHQVGEWWADSEIEAYHPPSDSGTLLSLTLREGRRTGDRIAILTHSAPLASYPDLPSLVLRERRAQKGVATTYTERVATGPGLIEERVGDLHFSISPSAFFQPNTEAAELLYSHVTKIVEPGMIVCDLYCGTGTLGLFAAQRAERVVGIELVEAAVLDARRNAERNGLGNAEFWVGDVAEILPSLPVPDLAIVDPPRAGLGKGVVETLVASGVPKIAYVSCNPKSQAVDIDQLTSGGYRVVQLQPLDQFPHTLHIENIALLERL